LLATPADERPAALFTQPKEVVDGRHRLLAVLQLVPWTHVIKKRVLRRRR
jgi:hypothetical protein